MKSPGLGDGGDRGAKASRRWRLTGSSREGRSSSRQMVSSAMMEVSQSSRVPEEGHLSYSQRMRWLHEDGNV